MTYLNQFSVEQFSVRDIFEKHWEIIWQLFDLQTWMHLEEEYQELTQQLEAVETNIPSVGLVEESEERLTDRISLYQVICPSAFLHISYTQTF